MLAAYFSSLYAGPVPRTESTMVARIYKPAQTAMQSGPARTKEWVLEYEPEAPREIDPLMGWTSSRDMKSQISLAFDTQEEAIAYAERNGIPYRLTEPKPGAPCASPTPTTSASAARAPGRTEGRWGQTLELRWSTRRGGERRV